MALPLFGLRPLSLCLLPRRLSFLVIEINSGIGVDIDHSGVAGKPVVGRQSGRAVVEAEVLGREY